MKKRKLSIVPTSFLSASHLYQHANPTSFFVSKMPILSTHDNNLKNIIISNYIIKKLENPTEKRMLTTWEGRVLSSFWSLSICVCLFFFFSIFLHFLFKSLLWYNRHLASKNDGDWTYIDKKIDFNNGQKNTNHFLSWSLDHSIMWFDVMR